ncbi:MAG: nucleotidyltransferase domain-containing protein [Candidatus Aenigmarchaeota archaeon]|nr:nucleotidyltransferase domain-containing protein [Candidatus Aenigmarchaeota archaeon]
MGGKESVEVNRIIKKIGSFKNSVGAERAVLFGSYARGNFKKDSDIDLILLTYSHI